jgi:hypothetical protein
MARSSYGTPRAARPRRPPLRTPTIVRRRPLGYSRSSCSLRTSCNQAPNDVVASVNALVAFALGHLMDRALGVLR